MISTFRSIRNTKKKYLLLDQGGQGQVIKEICECLPDIGISVFAQALVVETIDLGDLARLVITTEDGDAVLIADLEGNEQGHSLDRVVTTINVVSHEQVVGVRRIASDAEQLHQVVKLTVNITTDGDRATDRLDVGLLHQDLASLYNFISFMKMVSIQSTGIPVEQLFVPTEVLV